MSSNKCSKCGLVNSFSATTCKRCGDALAAMRPGSTYSPREAAKRSSYLYTLLFLALIAGCAYYLFNGFEQSYEKINASESNRLAAQPKTTPQPLTSRSEYDRGRTEPYKNAVANSPGLAASQKHNEDVNKLMQPPGQKK